MTAGRPPARRLGAGAILNLGIIAIGLLAIVGLLVVNLVSGDEPAEGERLELAIRLESVADGLGAPVSLVGPADGSGDRFVAEGSGLILRLRPDGSIDADAILDIRHRVLHQPDRVQPGGSLPGRGLLGLAVHPGYAENGRIFVSYSRSDDGATSISEFTLRDASAVDAATPESSERALLTIPQPDSADRAGMLAFDRDGMLLVSIGDGGSAGDRPGNGQDRASLLGKLLRLDVDRGWPYATPLDNGFATDPAAKPELHAIGLRNAWRFSVDRATGDLYLGDVGAGAWEEVNVLPRGAREASFGWSEMEGLDCLGEGSCDREAHLLPAVAYPRRDGEGARCSVIGGYAYRGEAGSLPDGTYLYADHCSGTMWAVPVEQLLAGRAQPTVVGRVPSELGRAVSFGQDDAGELYLLTDAGQVLAISAAAPA